MKKIFLALILTFSFFSNSFAETLLQALNQAFNNNAELNAERENLKISKEELNISKSNYLPSFTLSGSTSFIDASPPD